MQLNAYRSERKLPADVFESVVPL